MSNTITPNMALTLPGIGTEAGPTYAQDINNDMSKLDGHDHSSGYGVQINPAGININTSFSMNSNFITNAAGLSLISQSTTPAIKTVYAIGNDLWYNNGANSPVQITVGSAIAAAAGNISGLSSPASVVYSTPTFIFQSNTSIAGNLDAASLIMRNISPNSTHALTLSPPANLASNYTITLPTLPAAQSIVTLDNSGNMSGAYTLDSNTLAVTAGVLGVKAGGITTTQISSSAGILGSQLANNTITNTQIANSTIGYNQIATQGIAGFNIANATITGTQIAANTVTRANLVTSPIGVFSGSTSTTGTNITSGTYVGQGQPAIITCTGWVDGSGPDEFTINLTGPTLIGAVNTSFVLAGPATTSGAYRAAFSAQAYTANTGTFTIGVTIVQNTSSGVFSSSANIIVRDLA